MSHSNESSTGKLKYVDPVSFTPQFDWKKSAAAEAGSGEVVCERVPLESVAKRFGTPTYVYSRAAIDIAYRELHNGLGPLPHTLCFAVKSNGNLSILKHLAEMGSGFDIVSGGELDHLQRIGARGDRIVFSGVGKDRHEIRHALNYRAGERGGSAGILLFNVESEAELEILVEEAARLVARGNKPPAAAIRVNPDVQAGGHPHIATGRHEHKFGMDSVAGNQCTYWFADNDARAVSEGAWAAGGICRRVAGRGNRCALPGCWGRAGSALLGPEAADADGIRAIGFAGGAQTWLAPFAGAGAVDHSSRWRAIDARGLYENESGQDFCGGGLGDERFDAAGAVWGDSSDYESRAAGEGK